MGNLDLFGRHAESYDANRRQLVPTFDEFYGAVIRVLPFERAAAIRVLDLGAGTGLLAAAVRNAFSNAALHLTDASAPMLEQARERFAGDPNISYAVHDHLELAAESQYDAVVSALSIHHLTHEDKRELYRKIFAALRPGGIFVNADQVLAPTSALDALYQQVWLEHAHTSGIPPEALAQSLERTQLDRNAPLADQLSWLAEAGFTEIDCWFKNFRFAVFGGRKPGA